MGFTRGNAHHVLVRVHIHSEAIFLAFAQDSDYVVDVGIIVFSPEDSHRSGKRSEIGSRPMSSPAGELGKGLCTLPMRCRKSGGDPGVETHGPWCSSASQVKMKRRQLKPHSRSLERCTSAEPS